MKKTKIKAIALFSSIVMLLSIFCVPVMASENVSTDDKVLLAKSANEFLIYYKDLCSNEFEFALSTDKTTNVDELNFTKSAKDQTDGNNIAWIDSNTKSELGDETQAYIWIKNSNGEVVVEADLIDLEKALTNEQLNLVNTTTEKISVNTEGTVETNKIVDGVERTIIKGKAVIDEPKNGAVYSYVITLANNEEENSGKLYELANTIKTSTDTYEKLKLSKEFYDLYTATLPTSGWEKIDSEDLAVLQPEGTVDGDKYILWLKEETASEIVIDAQFLKSTNTEKEGTNEVEETVTETVKLPVTFDNGGILFTILAVIIIALIGLIIIRNILNKEKDK